jgi:hypothetical protein
MPLIRQGERELSERFDTFPAAARQGLADRITALTAELETRVQDAAPHLTGRLRSEIVGRTFTDQPDRVAGYVSVYAGQSKEYAKAATLEYGTDKPRRIFERSDGMVTRVGRHRIVERLTKPAHIAAFRYLRGPFEAMESEIAAELEGAVAEVSDGSGN